MAHTMHHSSMSQLLLHCLRIIFAQAYLAFSNLVPHCEPFKSDNPKKEDLSCPLECMRIAAQPNLFEAVVHLRWKSIGRITRSLCKRPVPVRRF